MLRCQVPLAEATWEDECIAKEITSRGCASKGQYSYPNLYAKHIKDNHGEYYENWESYNSAKVLVHELDALHKTVPCISCDALVCYLESRFDWLDTRIKEQDRANRPRVVQGNEALLRPDVP